MQFELLTLKGPKFRGEVAEVSLKTVEGELSILPHHEALTAIAVSGPVAVYAKANSQPELYATFGGLLEVRDNVVRLLADEAESAEELIQEEVEAALAKAKSLRQAARDKHELHRAQEMVDRHTVRLEVSRLRRRHRERPSS